MADLDRSDSPLCIIPPRSLWPQIDRVRSHHDTSFPSWPPHINLIHPFVPFKALGTHLGNISEAVKQSAGPIRVRLGVADHLLSKHGQRQVIFLPCNDVENLDEEGGRTFSLDRLCEAVLEAVPALERSAWHRSMIVGQSLVGESPDGLQSLLLRAGLLSGIEWEVDELHVLVKEGIKSGPCLGGYRMVDWASISLRDGSIHVQHKQDARLRACSVEKRVVAGRVEVPDVRRLYGDPTSKSPVEHVPFFYDGVKWILSLPDLSQQRVLTAAQGTLTVASYNVLGRTDDLPMLTQEILHTNAEADVLVLQETTGIFLSHLLGDQRVQERYNFCTHRPLNQEQSDAFRIQGMVIVLSRYAFDWVTIPMPQYEFEASGRKDHKKYRVGHNDLGGVNADKVSPFKSFLTGFESRTHNHALLLDFRKSERSPDYLEQPTTLALAAFHLTPGQDREAYLTRVLGLEAITNHILSSTPAILAGGFNMPTSALIHQYPDFQGDVRQVERDLHSSGYTDAWMIAKMESGSEMGNDPIKPKFQGEQGFTDESTSSRTVAKEHGHGHGQLSRRPLRLDRILVRPYGRFMVQSFNEFGKCPKAEEGEIVDKNFHFGSRAVVKLDGESCHLGTFRVTHDEHMSSIASQLDKGLSPHLKEPESVLEALRGVQGIPPLGERQLRERALEALKIVLGSPFHHASPDLEILPVGSYGLDVWTNSSDLDCLCVGTFSLPTFIGVATQRLQQAADSGIRLVRKTDTYAGTTLELVFEGHLKIDLTYARTTWPLPSSNPTRSLSPDTLVALKAFQDLDYVQRSVPDIANFRLAHRFIKMWAEGRGIYSARLGYLNGIQITMLLTRMHKRLATRLASPTVPEILFAFFTEYAMFDWGKNVVFDECFHKSLAYPRTSREPLAILGYFPPRLNASPSATASSVRTITSEFERAKNVLDQTDGIWAELLRTSVPGLSTSGSLASDEFLKRHQMYAKISVQYWGGSTTKGRGFVGWVESRCASLLADFDKSLTHLHVRIWPGRFKEGWQHDADQLDSTMDKGEYQGVILIGVDWMGPNNGEMPDSERDTLVSILKRFERQVRRDERHFDPTFMEIRTDFERVLHIPVSGYDLSTGQRVGEPQSARLYADNRNWDAYIRMDEDLDNQGKGRELGQATTIQSEELALSQNRRKSATNQPRSAVGRKPEGAGKLRTAADVLNRLRWDASYDHNDFVVGYEDRFLGTMERELDVWKTEQTHEEFIPQHRILYFKRSSDGVVVWERRTRTDLVFGSG